MTAALLATLGGSLGYGVASVLQGWAARRALGPAVVRHPAYLLGLVLDLFSWLASLYALRSLPLFTVQALLASSLAVTVLLSRVVLGIRLARRDGAAITTVTAALVVIVAAAGPPSDTRPPAWFSSALLVCLPLVAALLVAGYGRHSLALATIGGLAFSGAALCARTVHLTAAGSLPRAPLAWAAAGFGAVGAFAYARALEKGPVGPATAVLWLVEVVVPAVGGVAILGDRVRPGWAVPAVVAVLASILACSTMAVTRRTSPTG